MTHFDVVVVGSGTAGLPAALEAGERGLRTLVVEAAGEPGGTLWRSWAQMSAGGTSLQAARGIDDDPDQHFDDVMRISKGTADPELVRAAVDRAPQVIEWLLGHGFDMDPDAPAILHFHEPYRIARTYWGRRAGRSVLDVLLPQLEQAVAANRLEVRYRTAVTALLHDGQGRVHGVRVTTPDGEVEEISSHAVVLTSGGYAGNPELFPRLTLGAPLNGPADPRSTGSGLLAAADAGARLRGQDLFLPTYGGVQVKGSAWQTVHLDDYPQLTPQARPPWEIHVNARGERFVAEDADSVDDRENALLEQPDLSFWVVYDETTRREAPPLFPAWTADALDDAFETHQSFHRSDTLAGLAELAGVDPAGLCRTAETWNSAVAEGTDPLGRRHLVGTLVTPPFHAVRNHGTTLKSPTGLAVDAQMRVLGEDGPLAGLFAAGEVIGGSSLSGKSFVSGMSVTPALAFGRLAVETAAADLSTSSRSA